MFTEDHAGLDDGSMMALSFAAGRFDAMLGLVAGPILLVELLLRLSRLLLRVLVAVAAPPLPLVSRIFLPSLVSRMLPLASMLVAATVLLPRPGVRTGAVPGFSSAASIMYQRRPSESSNGFSSSMDLVEP